MKRISLLALSLLSCLLGVSSLGAQSVDGRPSFRQGLWIGAHGGVMASRFGFTPSVRQHTHLGYLGGLQVRYDIERGASLQVEVNYQRTGWRERYDASEMSYSRDLDYVDLPILTHLYLDLGGVKVFLNAGPFVGYQLRESAQLTGESLMGAQDKLRHELATRYPFFWGLGGGPGISIPLGRRQRIELEGRFVYGLGNIFSTERTSAYVQSSEMRFGLTMNYLFRLR